LGEMGLGEMGLGEMGQNLEKYLPKRSSINSSFCASKVNV